MTAMARMASEQAVEPTPGKIEVIPCATCGAPATCIGAYEGTPAEDAEPACDDCCGHGNEDGWCEPIEPPPAQDVLVSMALALVRGDARRCLRELEVEPRSGRVEVCS